MSKFQPYKGILPAALNELESPPTAPLSRAAPKGAYRESFLPELTGLPVNGSTGSNKLSWSA